MVCYSDGKRSLWPNQSLYITVPFNIVKLLFMEHKQLLPSATEYDVIDVLLEAKNSQLKQKIDGAIIAIIAK